MPPRQESKTEFDQKRLDELVELAKDGDSQAVAILMSDSVDPVIDEARKLSGIDRKVPRKS